MTKKITILIIVILLIVGVIGFFLFFNNDTGEQTGTREGNFFGNLFSSGDGGGSENTPLGGEAGEQDETTNNLPQSSGAEAAIQQLTINSVAGAMATSTTLPNTTLENVVVRYVDRATGNIFEIDPTSLVEKRLTNTTIPGIREVVWHQSGEQLIIRYLTDADVIKSIAATIGEQFEEGGELVHELEATFMDDDISYVTSSGEENKILYLLQNRTGITVGLRALFDSSNREVVFESPHSEWIPQWFENTIALTTKSSGTAFGFLYFVDSNGIFEKIIGNVQGLTTNTSPTGNTVLYSKSGDRGIQLFSLDVISRAIQTELLTTLPEKCVWSTKEEGVVYCGIPTTISGDIYPDVWYQGLVSFSDDVWEINIERDSTLLLASLAETFPSGIDVIDPFLGPNENFLFFTNKKDSTLWSLRLNR